MRRVRPLLALLLLLSAGCGSSTMEPAGAPHLRGVLRSVPEYPVAPGTTTRLLLEVPGAATPEDRYIVHVTPKTRIRRVAPDGALHRASLGELTVGTSLRVWTTGLVLESYPAQVFATHIQVEP